MRKIPLLVILLASFSLAQPEQLKNFDELFNILMKGEDVNVVIKYSMTKLIIDGTEEEAPDAIGGMVLETYEYFAEGVVRNVKAYISCSERVFIHHGYYGYVYNYVKLRIYEDNSVEIIAQYLDPKSYEVKMDEKFVTVINDGINEGGIFFYSD